jgi:MoxR-like ATPase
VLATQNPIESEGVYTLPEAQRDRFLMQIVVHQPSFDEEVEIARRMSAAPPEAMRVLTAKQLLALQAEATAVFVHHAVRDYAVRIVMATREPTVWGMPELEGHLALGASPRATLGLLAAARAHALLHGRTHAVPKDVFEIAPEVLRHRLLLSYDALAEHITVDDIITKVLGAIEPPRVAPHQDELADAEAPAPSEVEARASA